MLKFRFFYAGEFHLGFARRFKASGDDRYLVVLLNGSSMTIMKNTDQRSEGSGTWFQVKKAGEIVQTIEFVQIIGAALETAKEV